MRQPDRKISPSCRTETCLKQSGLAWLAEEEHVESSLLQWLECNEHFKGQIFQGWVTRWGLELITYLYYIFVMAVLVLFRAGLTDYLWTGEDWRWTVVVFTTKSFLGKDRPRTYLIWNKRGWKTSMLWERWNFSPQENTTSSRLLNSCVVGYRSLQPMGSLYPLDCVLDNCDWETSKRRSLAPSSTPLGDGMAA